MDTVPVEKRWLTDGFLYPWQRYIAEKLVEKRLPQSTRGRVLVASDSSSPPGCDFDVYSFLVFDEISLRPWAQLVRNVRETYLPDGRRMSYKRLSDRMRQAAFHPFLGAANTLEGFCATIAINKSIRHLIFDAADFEVAMRELRLGVRRDNKSIERMLRTTYFLALLLAGYVIEGQEILWISDEDDVFANKAVTQDTINLASIFLGGLSLNRPGPISVCTTSVDPGDRVEEDLVAVADILAGGIAESMTLVRQSVDRGSFKRAYPVPSGLPERVTNFINWFSDDGRHRLRRISLYIDGDSETGFRVGFWRMEPMNVVLPRIILPKSSRR